MKKNMKEIFIMSLVLLLVTGCGCSKKVEKEKEEVKVNTSEDVIKDQEVDGLKLQNTSLVVVNGSSIITTQVINHTGSDYYLNEFKIVIKDASGNEITRIPGYVGEVIKDNEVRNINTSIDRDFSTLAASIEYIVDK